ncbi:MAG TPA: hypothetical protein VMI35_11055 [Puia sp.]|nr:hypothetical protein [Puia sp.]
MRYLFVLLTAFVFSQAYSQRVCPKNSRLYEFDPNSHPRNFTERLGNHPEFPFLQRINGVTTPDLFIKSINNPANQQKYEREFKAFDLLLRNSGFTRGYLDLSEKNVENIFITAGTIGNLGFYDRQKDLINYIYVKLNPAGESPDGIAAWKLTNKKGCYLYVLHTCGNAFYPNNSAAGECCKTFSVETEARPVVVKNDSFDRPLHLSIDFYQARLVASKQKKSGYDTVVNLVRHIDSTTSFKDRDGRPPRILASAMLKQILVCKDTSLKLGIQLTADSTMPAASHEPIQFKYADTAWIRENEEKAVCKTKWEFTVEGGMSFNSAPKFNSATQHSQTDGSHPAVEVTLSRIFNHWFQLGVSASYITLAYQDDFPYVGATPGTYSEVFIGTPIFPIQLFAKANIGKPTGWQSSIAISGGYSIPTYSKIVNNGNTLNVNPQVKGGPTVGFKLGIAYFFTCNFGLGATFTGQYFSNSSALMNYNLFALPITGGLRFRF